MRKWLWCVTTLCLAALLAACGEEDPKELAKGVEIDPSATEEQRKILRATVEIVIAECPALANVLEWYVENGADLLVEFHTSYFGIIFDAQGARSTRPPIETWTHFGKILFTEVDFWDGDVHGIPIAFSWSEPPGIAIHAPNYDAVDRAESARRKKACDFVESHPDHRSFWFKRVDALAEIVKD